VCRDYLAEASGLAQVRLSLLLVLALAALVGLTIAINEIAMAATVR
jgi:hypothetical protein